MQLSDEGEPLYGERDVPDLEAIRTLGLPFWLAGSYAEPRRVAEALRMGATGVQIGTAFAYCEESGLDHELKERVLAMSQTGEARVFTDPIASPTGFPFKVLQMADTHSNSTTYEKRARICDLKYLRHAYKKPDGTLGWRCPGEPVEDYLRKGGQEEDTRGRRCLCNGLVANIGLGQIQKGGEQEKPLLTSGDDVANVARFLKPGARSYRAVDVIAPRSPVGVPSNLAHGGRSCSSAGFHRGGEPLGCECTAVHRVHHRWTFPSHQRATPSASRFTPHLARKTRTRVMYMSENLPARRRSNTGTTGARRQPQARPGCGPVVIN